MQVIIVKTLFTSLEYEEVLPSSICCLWYLVKTIFWEKHWWLEPPHPQRLTSDWSRYMSLAWDRYFEELNHKHESEKRSWEQLKPILFRWPSIAMWNVRAFIPWDWKYACYDYARMMGHRVRHFHRKGKVRLFVWYGEAGMIHRRVFGLFGGPRRPWRREHVTFTV